ncbi:MAG TPA: VRR-NUC domain-containing protein [Terrisporobacter glycolicus]|uniref:VRR-NUC domain-containing protein n=1 Tax=Terrisporobacter TaxID=1505652 RepID=UPI000E9B66A8|nr:MULTISPECIES: VRR-NUC domain-containing protein [Terrisporobacter]HBI92754.1 VRR-NUC domain-containing protein [Terrisporobacter hibernicus]
MKSREAQEQAVVISWCKMQENVYPAVKNIYAIPNGGYRNKIEAKNLKLQGVKSGVPDLHLAYPNSFYHGLYIEMKWGKNKPTENQEDWIKRLSAVGYKCEICWSSEEAIEVIKQYLNIKEQW